VNLSIRIALRVIRIRKSEKDRQQHNGKEKSTKGITSSTKHYTLN